MEAPILSVDDKSKTQLTDTYIQPVRLGWRRAKSDFLVGLGVFVPTGDYEFRGDSNSGLGMWSFELFAGATVYFDEKKNWHLATTAFYETHTNKKDTEIRVGDILTLEGGLGRSFLGGGANAGVAYYAQWKVTADDLSILPPAARLPAAREPPPRQEPRLRCRARAHTADSHQGQALRFRERALPVGVRGTDDAPGEHVARDAHVPAAFDRAQVGRPRQARRPSAPPAAEPRALDEGSRRVAVEGRLIGAPGN
jgi:hypothetical protein